MNFARNDLQKRLELLGDFSWLDLVEGVLSAGAVEIGILAFGVLVKDFVLLVEAHGLVP